jgi:hypothetical protein
MQLVARIANFVYVIRHNPAVLAADLSSIPAFADQIHRDPKAWNRIAVIMSKP